MKTRITETLGIEYPIIQGGVTWMVEHNLVAAVSEAGSLGLTDGASAPGEVVCDEIRKVRELIDKPLGVSVMLLSPHADDTTEVVMEEGVKVVTTGAGSPEKYMETWKVVGIKMIPVVAGVALAHRVEKYGVDAVVAEGMESSGYIGEQTTMTLVPQVADAVSIPVTAVGGIGDRRGMAVAFMLGAETVQMGIRLMVVKESIVHENYKQRIIKAKDIDSMVIGRNHDHPVKKPRDQTTREYIKLERKDRSLEELEYLTLGALRRAVIEDDIDGGTVMAGQIAGMIPKEQICKEMIEETTAQAGKLMHWNQGSGTQTPGRMETNRIQGKEITGISKIAFIFPGQGAQACGAGKGFYKQIEIGKRISGRTTQLMGFSMSQLCFEKSDKLDITEYTQAVMVTASTAMIHALEESEIKPDVAVGLSLRRYCTLAVAEVMSDEDTIWTVRQRGVLIQETTPMGEGIMAATLTLDAAMIEEVTGAMEGVWIASYNCPGQIVVSDEKATVEEAYKRSRAAETREAVMLNVSGPPHSGMLTTADGKLEQVLSRVESYEPRIPCVANVTTQYVKSAVKVKELLTRQVSPSVRQRQSVKAMIGDGVDTFTEIGLGKALAGSMRKISQDVKTLNMEKLEDIDKVTEAFKS